MQTPAAPNFNLWCTCSIQKPHYVWEHDADCKRPNCMTKKPHKLTECIDYRESQYGRGVAPQRSDNNTQCKSCDNSKPHKNFDHAPCKCGYHQQVEEIMFWTKWKIIDIPLKFYNFQQKIISFHVLNESIWICELDRLRRGRTKIWRRREEVQRKMYEMEQIQRKIGSGLHRRRRLSFQSFDFRVFLNR